MTKQISLIFLYIRYLCNRFIIDVIRDFRVFQKSLIKILTSKIFSDIKCRCIDRFEKGGQSLGKRGCEVV